MALLWQSHFSFWPVRPPFWGGGLIHLVNSFVKRLMFVLQERPAFPYSNVSHDAIPSSPFVLHVFLPSGVRDMFLSKWNRRYRWQASALQVQRERYVLPAQESSTRKCGYMYT